MRLVTLHYRCLPRHDGPHVSEVWLMSNDADTLNELQDYFSTLYCFVGKTKHGIRIEAKKILHDGFTLLQIMRLMRQFHDIVFCFADDFLSNLELGFKEKKRIAYEAIGDFVNLSAIHWWSGEQFSDAIVKWSANRELLCHLSGFSEFEGCHCLPDVLIKMQNNNAHVSKAKHLFSSPSPDQVAFSNLYGLWSVSHFPMTRLLRYLPITVTPVKSMR
jgi:hypothetical protein